jgi:hypothetical protein
MEESGQQRLQHPRVVILPRTAPDPGDLARTGALRSYLRLLLQCAGGRSGWRVRAHATQDARHAIASRSARQPATNDRGRSV